MSVRVKSSLLGASLVTVLLTSVTVAQADEVKVMAANAVKEPFLELVAAFEKATGHKVTAVWSGTAGVTQKISGGEVVDVVIVGAANIDKLIREGKLLAGSRVDFAKSGVGIAVREGLPKPDISSAEAVKKAVLEAKSVAYSSGPSGLYIAELFKRMGIAEQVKDKLKLPPSNVLVGEVLARGEADLGFQQVSDLLHVKGIVYVGPLPAEIQNTTVYAAALHTKAPAPEAAKSLVKVLTAPAAGPIITKAGMAPG
jgi:molybdate transport system substrate-binding protein